MSDRTLFIRLLTSVALSAATVLIAGTASAQARPGEQAGLRYLSWAGKPASAAGDDLRRPGVIPRQTASATPAPMMGRNSRYGSPTPGVNAPTPASAWISGPPRPLAMPQAPSQSQPQPQPQPYDIQAQTAVHSPGYGQPQVQQGRMAAPVPSEAQMMASAPAYDPSRAFRRQDPYYAAPPQVQAAMQPSPQPTYMPPPAPIPTAIDPAMQAQQQAQTQGQPSAPYDPNAPRRDALIFSMNQGGAAPGQPQAQAQQPQYSPQPQYAPQYAPAPADPNAPRQLAQAAPTQSGQPPRESARYYSVHREAGHEPDAMTLPESVFIGGGATPDLAEPPAVPIMPRVVNGRAQVVANQEPVLP